MSFARGDDKGCLATAEFALVVEAHLSSGTQSVTNQPVETALMTLTSLECSVTLSGARGDKSA